MTLLEYIRIGNRTLFYQALFLVTGVTSTLLNQFVYYNGAAEKSTLLPVLAACLGNSFAVFLPKNKKKNQEDDVKDEENIPQFRIFLAGLLEFSGTVLSLIGLVFAGSGLYQVVYSSIVLFVALFSRIWLHRVLSSSQIGALVLIVVGLAVSALGSTSTTADGNSQLVGIGFTILGTIVFGMSYVVGEELLTKSKMHPFTLQTMVSTWALLFIVIYTVIHTLPNFDMLVINEVKKNNGDVTLILLAYIALMLSAFLHTYSYYALLQYVGSVSTGVLQSLRAVSVFWLSSMFYCSAHSEQCLTIWKLVSTALVVVGQMWYSKATQQSAKKKHASEELDP